MKNKRVLIAETSKTISRILAEALKEAGYSIKECTDGIEALKLHYKENYDIILASSLLPNIDGFNLCRIVKGTRKLSKTVFIICTPSIVNESKFWADAAQSDGLYEPSPENIHYLLTLIDKGLARTAEIKDETTDNPYRKSKETNDKELNDTALIKLVTEAFGEDFFKLNLIKNAFNAENYIWDIDSLLIHISSTISGIYAYDALGIIINDETLIEYYDYSDSLTKNDVDDFKKICRSDFTSRISSRKEFNWKTSITIENIIETLSDDNIKLKNYEFFPIDPSKKLPITLHISTSDSRPIDMTTQKRIDFFVETYSIVIEKAIVFRKIEGSERKIRLAFSRFLPTKVINSIVQGDKTVTSAIGEQRKVAILMADIRNFTALTEQNEPEAVITFLNNYFTKMGNIIKKHGGTIDKFMGDEIMALFGVPESFKYNADRAANAAVEMIEEVKNMDTHLLKFPEGQKFEIGIGIHYGEPISGTIGSEDKKEYTVIGDDVNIASRVQNLTKLYGTPILITGQVRRDIEEAEKDKDLGKYLLEKTSFKTRYLDNVKVKGKSIPVEIFEIMGTDNNYSENFLMNYSKGLYQYLMGNFYGAQDYLRIAKILMPKDKATKVLLERCKEFARSKPKDWDGAITLTNK